MRNRETIWFIGENDITWNHPNYITNRVQLEFYKHFKHKLSSSVEEGYTCVLNSELFYWCLEHLDEWVFWTRKICWISFKSECDLIAFKLRWS